MSVCLPDINVLIALTWPSHLHHAIARGWFESLGSSPWATCPLTQSGFVRVSSNPRIIADAVTPREAVRVLQRLERLGEHVFWPDDLDFSADGAIPTSHLMGHRQVTDAYLLGLAIRRGATLVAFDRSISDLLPSTSPHRSALTVLGGPAAA